MSEIDFLFDNRQRGHDRVNAQLELLHKYLHTYVDIQQNALELRIRMTYDEHQDFIQTIESAQQIITELYKQVLIAADCHPVAPLVREQRHKVR